MMASTIKEVRSPGRTKKLKEVWSPGRTKKFKEVRSPGRTRSAKLSLSQAVYKQEEIA